LLRRRKLEKLRKKLKASQKEVQDLQSEFQVERDDFLETIRGAERELKLFTAIAKRYRTPRLQLFLAWPALIRDVQAGPSLVDFILDFLRLPARYWS
jgi:hypothetical protein